MSKMRQADGLDALPRYVYGLLAIVFIMGGIGIAVMLQQWYTASRYERQLSQYHLPTTAALSFLSKEIGEVRLIFRLRL